MTVTAPLVHPSASRLRTAAPLGMRILRLALAVALLALGATAVLFESTLRVTESRVLASLLQHVFGADAVAAWSAGHPAVAYQLGDAWLAVRITVQCSIALYLGPLSALAGLVLLSPRIRIRRVLSAAVVGMVALVALNQLRLVLIAFAYGAGGMDAFNWMHGPIGSALMLVGIAGVLVAFFAVCLKRRRPARR